jgi:ABC-2 type transport system permease protein
MRGFWSIYRKELYSLFASPIFYVVGFIFLVISGYFYYGAVLFYSRYSFQAAQDPMAMSSLNLTEMVLRPFFLDMSVVLLLLTPLLTMRVYAEERKSGTLELLFTYPVSDRATLLAKFTAVTTTLGVILLATVPCLLLLGYVGKPNWPAVYCGYLGVLLLGSAFLALGLFTSAMTQNQIVAAILSFGALLMFWVIGWMKSFVGATAAKVINYISVTRHFDSFAKGVLDARDLVFYLAFILVFLFLTLRQVESYRWRG